MVHDLAHPMDYASSKRPIEKAVLEAVARSALAPENN